MYMQNLISEYVATQCPLSGSPAVYRARSLWGSLYGSRRYADSASCAAAGIAYRHEETDAPLRPFLLRAYPNPTTGYTTIDWSELPQPLETAQLRLLDPFGRVVWSRAVSGETHATADLQHLPNGAYWLQRCANGNCSDGLLLIVHP